MKRENRRRFLFSAAGVVLALAMGSSALAYEQAPALQERVAKGELPPVDQRLPASPVMIKPLDGIGVYGGDLRTDLLGGTDRGYGWLRRTVGYEYLVQFEPGGFIPMPNVAEIYEVNADSTVFTFHLRKGMRWSDGAPLTADDFVFWFENVALNKELSPSGPGPSLVVKGKPAKLTKIDDHTISYTFTAPYGLFFSQVASGFSVAMVAPKHYATTFHKDFNPQGIDALVKQAGVSSWVDLFTQKVGGTTIANDIGGWLNPELPTLNAWLVTTPYDGSSSQVVTARNPYYWKVDSAGNQLPYLDRLVLPIIGDPEVLKLMTINGQVDFVYRPQNFGITDKSVFFDNQEQGKFHFVELKADVSAAQVIHLNMASKDPAKRELYGNKKFRMALSYAINRPEVIEIVYFGQGEPYQMAPRPESPFYDERMAHAYTEYDPAQANKLLDEIGFTRRNSQNFRLGADGKRIVVPVDVRTETKQQLDSLELIKRYWADVGIDLQINAMDSALYKERQLSNLHEAASNVGAGGLNELLNPRQYVPVNDNAIYGIPWVYWYLGDPRGEEPPPAVKKQLALYDQVKATADPEHQAELFRQVLAIAADEFRIIGISLLTGGYAIAANRLGNVPEVMINSAIYPTPAPTNLSTWYIKPAG